MIEIRDYVDKDSLVVHTNEFDTFRRLGKSSRCTRVIRYFQREGIVGADLYFPRRHKKWLLSQTRS